MGQKSVSQKKRGSKLLRCGAKRQVAAFAGTRVYLLSLIDHLRKYPALEVQSFCGAIVCLRRHKSWPFASDLMSANADNRFVEDPDF